MKTKSILFWLLAFGAVALSACAAPATGGRAGAPSPTAAMAEELAKEDKAMSTATPAADKMMDETATPAADRMMDETATPAADEVMDETATPIADEGMDETATPIADEVMDDQAAKPAWFTASLTDVSAGETFTVADLKGKVVLVEMMAIWCPTCLRQQREVAKLKAMLGERDDFATVTLDVDPNESPEDLKAYAAQHGFGGRYAVAGASVAREIAALYGDQFINPPSAPMLVIDRQGMAHPLPFRVKTAEELKAVVEPFLAEGM
jgi:cytochrome oxidase Cu insertion factor (SCO1/SenC/PrrC family)